MARWRGGSSAALVQAQESAQRALDQLKDAFFALDYSQRAVRASVESYEQILPERAGRSGLVPRHRVLDRSAEEQAGAYLALVDQWTTTAASDEGTLRQAAFDYAQAVPRLSAVTAELDAFGEQWADELGLVGRETRKMEEQRRAGADAVAQAQAAWEGLRAQGLESSAADTAFAKARVAQRGVEAWTPGLGLPQLRERVELVRGFAEEVHEAVAAYPAQVERARRRAPSLRTRLDAISTRSAGIATDLGALRREFSMGNWEDLEGRDRVVADLVAVARGKVDRLAEAVRREAWDEAVARLVEAEAAVVGADDAVDAPRERLTALRELKTEPRARLDKVRFALKDAQTLVVRGPVRDAHDIAATLDTLAFQLDGLRPLTEGVHPNYWAVLTSAERVEREVAAAVARYRERAR